jgi:hypothetical protein
MNECSGHLLGPAVVEHVNARQWEAIIMPRESELPGLCEPRSGNGEPKVENFRKKDWSSVRELSFSCDEFAVYGRKTAPRRIFTLCHFFLNKRSKESPRISSTLCCGRPLVSWEAISRMVAALRRHCLRKSD